MLLLLELDSVSSSGISGNTESFGSDLVASSVHAVFVFGASSVRVVFVFGGSVSELPAVRLLIFFGL